MEKSQDFIELVKQSTESIHVISLLLREYETMTFMGT